MSNLISKKYVEKTGVGTIRHSQRRTYRLKDYIPAILTWKQKKKEENCYIRV
jgi:uncharacterized protein YbaR (Trm112 family)